MYENISLKEYDCENWSMEKLLNDTYVIYTNAQEKQFGTLAIKFKLVE